MAIRCRDINTDPWEGGLASEVLSSEYHLRLFEDEQG
jgi:hypothetical protein